MKLTHASVFSGIGGPEVAATMLGWDNLFHCEINPFGRAVLDYWYPNSKSYEDITTTDFSEWRGRVHVLTGGFPCQPFSYAGQRRGATDDRYLWPYMFRCIDQIQPDWVVAENVAGILTMVEQGEVSQVASSADLFDTLNDIRGYRLRETFTLQRICDDLEGHGYAVQPVLVPACAVGAPHRRDRVFIIGRRITADADNGRVQRLSNNGEQCDQRHNGQPCESSQQERLGNQQGRQSDETRTKATVSQDPVCGGQLVGRDGEQGSERNERNAGARGGQRICAETSRTAPADSVGSGAGTSRTSGSTQGDGCNPNQQPSQRRTASEWSDRFYAILRNAADTDNGCTQGCGNVWRGLGEAQGQGPSGRCSDGSVRLGEGERCGERWWHFPTVSPVHRGNDGLPFDVDDLTIPFSKWRTEALKAYGNAIVPQVMYEIFRAIEITYS